MTTDRMGRLLSHLRSAACRLDGDPPADADLLERFLCGREEYPFAELVLRHGPMVLGVCRRVLGNGHDADDAFQATFLVLARKASSLRPSACLAPWLYGVARRTALKARASSARRRLAEQRAARERPWYVLPPIEAELPPVIDEAIGQLPEKYRAPIVLCLLQEKSRKEAAGLLGWSEGTLSGRLARAKDLLADRLRRRGVAPAILTGGAFTATVSAPLASAAGALRAPAPVLALTEEVMTSMLVSKLKKMVGLLALMAGVGFGTGAVAWYGGPTGGKQATQGSAGEARARAGYDKQAAQHKYVIEAPDVLKVEYDADPVRIAGPRLVRPDGTIGLGLLGAVKVAGLTVEKARAAVSKHLSGRLDGFDAKKLVFDVAEVNGKFIYVIYKNGKGEESLTRFTGTGNETVLDVLGKFHGAETGAFDAARITLRRLAGEGKKEQVLPVDWKGIITGGQAATNYQLLHGDRLFVEERADEPLDAEGLKKLPRPSNQEMALTLPKSWADAKVESVTFQVFSSRAEPSRKYPLVGQARAVHVHWKCIVKSDRGDTELYLDRTYLVPEAPGAR